MKQFLFFFFFFWLQNYFLTKPCLEFWETQVGH